MVKTIEVAAAPEVSLIENIVNSSNSLASIEVLSGQSVAISKGYMSAVAELAAVYTGILPSVINLARRYTISESARLRLEDEVSGLKAKILGAASGEAITLQDSQRQNLSSYLTNHVKKRFASRNENVPDEIEMMVLLCDDPNSYDISSQEFERHADSFYRTVNESIDRGLISFQNDIQRGDFFGKLRNRVKAVYERIASDESIRAEKYKVTEPPEIKLIEDIINSSNPLARIEGVNVQSVELAREYISAVSQLSANYKRIIPLVVSLEGRYSSSESERVRLGQEIGEVRKVLGHDASRVVLLEGRIGPLTDEVRRLGERNGTMIEELATMSGQLREARSEAQTYRRIIEERRDRKILSGNATRNYAEWVRENYPAEMAPENVHRFIPHDVNDKKPLDALARFILYSELFGSNVILNGPTGTGKTTLVEYVAQRERRPFHKVPPIKELTFAQAVCELMEDHNKDMVFAPGPVMKYLINGGYLFLDEITNINAKLAIAFHDLLQGKGLSTLTQYGVANFEPERGKHMIVGAGNFSYAKPNFNRATLQRCTFMDIPPLSQELLQENLKGVKPRNGRNFEEYKGLLEQAYPWFFRENNGSTTNGYLWTGHLRGANDILQSLVDMSTELRTELYKFSKFGRQLDVSEGAIRRVISLYSPHMGQSGLRDIVSENLINPITIEYPGQQEERGALHKVVFKAMERYYERLKLKK